MKRYQIKDSTLKWLEIILSERFGHKWILTRSKDRISLKLEGSDGKIFFDNLQSCFTEPRSDLPCIFWNAEQEGWISVIGGLLPAPGVDNLPYPLIEQKGVDYIMHYDILGLTYWMLARIEEIGRSDLDIHQRFPASSSHAYKFGYLDRPIVDEWLCILGQVIKCQWPGLELIQHEFSFDISHDVDRPFQYLFVNAYNMVRQFSYDLIKQTDFILAYRQLISWFSVHLGSLKSDPFNTFDWLMSQSEEHSIQSTFYFMGGHSQKERDSGYQVQDPVIRRLLRRIHDRGHIIGLHPSYNCYKDVELIKKEFQVLKKVCHEEGIQQKQWGGRMHFLRWENPTTACLLEEAEFDYDSTLSYADYAGFRCGTCHEFTMYSPKSDYHMSLKQRPLIVMDQTIISEAYMGLGYSDKAIEIIQKYKYKCQLVRGNFTLLWHNSELQSEASRKFYSNILSNNFK